jgi:hypothetical protein
VLGEPGAARWRHAVLALPRGRRVHLSGPAGALARLRADCALTRRHPVPRVAGSPTRKGLHSHSQAGPAHKRATASNTRKGKHT